MKKILLILILFCSFHLTAFAKEKESSIFLSQLELTNGELNMTFDPLISEYSVTIAEDVESLGVLYDLSEECGGLIIHGNEFIKDGSVVTIQVLSSEDKIVGTYILNVNVSDESYVFDDQDSSESLEIPSKVTNNNVNQTMAIVIGIICFGVIFFFFFLFFLKNRKKKEV